MLLLSLCPCNVKKRAPEMLKDVDTIHIHQHTMMTDWTAIGEKSAGPK